MRKAANLRIEIFFHDILEGVREMGTALLGLVRFFDRRVQAPCEVVPHKARGFARFFGPKGWILPNGVTAAFSKDVVVEGPGLVADVVDAQHEARDFCVPMFDTTARW
jgi:hypothetical protein